MASYVCFVMLEKVREFACCQVFWALKGFIPVQLYLCHSAKASITKCQWCLSFYHNKIYSWKLLPSAKTSLIHNLCCVIEWQKTEIVTFWLFPQRFKSKNVLNENVTFVNGLKRSKSQMITTNVLLNHFPIQVPLCSFDNRSSVTAKDSNLLSNDSCSLEHWISETVVLHNSLYYTWLMDENIITRFAHDFCKT